MPTKSCGPRLCSRQSTGGRNPQHLLTARTCAFTVMVRVVSSTGWKIPGSRGRLWSVGPCARRRGRGDGTSCSGGLVGRSATSGERDCRAVGRRIEGAYARCAARAASLVSVRHRRSGTPYWISAVGKGLVTPCADLLERGRRVHSGGFQPVGKTLDSVRIYPVRKSFFWAFGVRVNSRRFNTLNSFRCGAGLSCWPHRTGSDDGGRGTTGRSPFRPCPWRPRAGAGSGRGGSPPGGGSPRPACALWPDRRCPWSGLRTCPG